MKIEIEEERFFEDKDLVEYRTDLEGWTGPDRLYYGKGDEGERRARYGNSTHKKCECGNTYQKNSYCSPCSEIKSKERFLKLDEVEWDGKSMMAIYNDERFFSDMDDVFEYCKDNEIDIKDLKLVHCEKQINISEVNIDEMNEEYMTENGDGVSHYHPEIADKVAELNELIKNTEPKLWFQTDTRIKIENN